MRIHRFIGNFDLAPGEIQVSNPDQINQIKNVLKLEPGEKIILSDGAGNEALGEIKLVAKDKVIVSIEQIEKSPGAEHQVNLYLAILKKENFELAVQKAVECGVNTITPIITERTVKTGLNMERLQKIILEATEQSGRSALPELFDIFPFEEAIVSEADQKIIFHINPEAKEFTPNPKAKSVNVFIGPEGGFTEREIALAREHGYTPASLGKSTLRGETAAIVATYRAVHGI
jgi:16S rRNA (uracil1498-N3)-methyltransferase